MGCQDEAGLLMRVPGGVCDDVCFSCQICGLVVCGP